MGSSTKFRDNYIFNNDKTILSFVESDIIYFVQEVSETTLEIEFDEMIEGETIRVNYIFSRD